MSIIRIVGVSGGLSQPSRTTSLVSAVLRELEALAPDPVETSLLEIAQLGPLFGQYLLRPQLPAAGEAVLRLIEQAHVIVAGSPVFKGAYTGQFKHLFDMIDYDALRDVPVVLVATGGSDRHTLMTDHALRPLFSFFRAHTVPTSLYATARQIDDDARIIDDDLQARVSIAAQQALHLRAAPAAREIPTEPTRSHAAP
ncbi:MAG: NAD(P)H-dependent oxidoreductase [Polyangiales bacterium]